MEKRAYELAAGPRGGHGHGLKEPGNRVAIFFHGRVVGRRLQALDLM
jgi:hypothetical protein